MENYRIVRKLGSGNFAKVYLAIHEPSGRQVALKLIDKTKTRDSSMSFKMIKRVYREIANMKKVTHPNIVDLHESFETDQHHVIAMEYVSGGELFDHVQQHQGLPEHEAKRLFQQIAEAVQHCHENSVVHRDLKLENILLDRDGLPKLADFGFSKAPHSQEMVGTYCGSPLYASPEMILGKTYFGPECDTWSLGIILYTMLTATMPFDDRDFPHFIKSLKSGVYAEPAGSSKSARDLISRMLDPNPQTRATIQEILAHHWLQASKTPPDACTKARKSNVCYSTMDALEIRDTLIETACECDCSCHPMSKERRDSVITNHCSDCEEILVDGPTKVHGVSRNSSGYGSETGSMLFTPRVSLVEGTMPFDTERKTSHPFFSKSPIPPVPRILELDDEEIVFV